MGSHHIKRFLDAGGTDKEIGVATAISAISTGVKGYHFVKEYWTSHLPDLEPKEQFLDVFCRVAIIDSPCLAHMAACAVHTCLGNWLALSWQIEAAYEAGIDELQLAEAISIAILPGSVPNYVRAAEVWRQLILEKKIRASKPFERWASFNGQGGYDEASGVLGQNKTSL